MPLTSAQPSSTPLASDAGNDLRSLILAASRDLLLAEGVDGLSMRKIAHKIGYSPTALYLHFPHKDAILHAHLDEGLGMLHRTLEEALAAVDAADTDARLRALAETYVRWGEANPARYEVMFLLHPRHMERYPPEKFRMARRTLDLFSDVLVDAGFSAEVARVAGSAAWAQLHGFVALQIARRFDVRLPADALRQTVVDSVVRGALAAR